MDTTLFGQNYLLYQALVLNLYHVVVRLNAECYPANVGNQNEYAHQHVVVMQKKMLQCA